MSQLSPQHPSQQVFEHVLARPVNAPDGQHGRLVHLAWSAPAQGDRLVQFYVNAELAGVSASPTEREAWLVLDTSVHHQIELLAVDPVDAATPSSQLLAGLDPPTQPMAAVGLLRDMRLPIDAQLSISLDEQIPVSTPLFSIDTPRGGFGAVFGEGGFGYDASTGPGLGLGQLGYGPLGTDGDLLRWQDATLSPGTHTLQLALHDTQGQPAAQLQTLNLTINRLPDPPGALALGGDLQLTWT